MSSRQDAVAHATDYFDNGSFEAELPRRVAIPSESQTPGGLPHCRRYLEEEMTPAFREMGFETRLFENPEEHWTKGAVPWKTARDGDRLYGRGTADNKGQHTINMAALDAVLRTRGSLGFNAKFMIETGEENGSAGVAEVVGGNLDAFRPGLGGTRARS